MITSAYALAWLRAFAVTQAVEVPIYTRLSRATRVQAFGASLLTHPVVWFVIFPCLPASYLTKSIAAELWAWLAEAAYLRALGLDGRDPRPAGSTTGWRCGSNERRWWRALAVSLAANAASVAVGLTLRALTGYP